MSKGRMMIPMTRSSFDLLLTVFYYAHAFGKSTRYRGDGCMHMYGDFSVLFLHYRRIGYPYVIIPPGSINTTNKSLPIIIDNQKRRNGILSICEP
jgi:hypothetical protein